ncbi:hypothetical protein PR202_gb01626 [Eleusine coracana subsp. coracana]|uniref:Uncharacterized protein n=1 Tax=Eleusine coracana subsp. coracana TaxID=191504 RepID=A0AAV5DWS3_ELECO|nr:hypothetical protein PR202_gb01626 [Eleusine coracana subsp. coracana]
MAAAASGNMARVAMWPEEKRPPARRTEPILHSQDGIEDVRGWRTSNATIAVLGFTREASFGVQIIPDRN